MKKIEGANKYKVHVKAVEGSVALSIVIEAVQGQGALETAFVLANHKQDNCLITPLEEKFYTQACSLPWDTLMMLSRDYDEDSDSGTVALEVNLEVAPS